MRIKLSRLALVFAASLTTFSAPILLNAQESARRDVRFYKVNRQIQANRIRFTANKAALPGCHNFLKRSRIHKAVQIGYTSCRLFAEKDCAAESIVAVSRETEKVETDDLATANLEADDLATANLEADELETAEPTEVRATTNTLSEGAGWYPVSDHRRGVKLRSWSCSLTKPAEPAVKPISTNPDLADPQLTDPSSMELKLPKLGG